jgi:uncharacterized protein (TIGR01777 family)
MTERRGVLVTGATGLVGARLVRALRADDVAVHAVTRSSGGRFPSGVQAVRWDGVRVEPEALAHLDAVVHLAGEPVFGGLLTNARRARIRDSRIASTRALVESMAALPPEARPRTFVCASAVGYYGSRGDATLDESAPPGKGFLADVCVAWEEAARAAAGLGVRSVSLRIGIVLARDGGALVPMARAFQLFAGGRLGDGRQWFPWIHVDDLVAMLRAAIDDERWTGAINAVAPNPVRNLELTRTLAATVRRPALLPVPAFALRALLGELADELLGSRRVVPARANALGFQFRFDDLAPALEAELRPA